MFTFVIWVYCGLPWKKGRPRILQLLNLGTQFLNPGQDPDWIQLKVEHWDWQETIIYHKICRGWSTKSALV